MADDDAPGPEPFRPPLPPDDRLWRHPSEVAAGGDPSPRRAVRLAPLAVAAGVGAVSALLAAWGLGAFGDRVVERQVVERVAVADPAAPAVATTPAHRAVADLHDTIVSVRAGETAGSGVLLRDDGHVVTTAELVGDHERVWVRTQDGPVLEGEVLGTDPATDVAVLAVPGLTRPGAVLGRPGEATVGDRAVVLAVDPAGAPEVAVGVVARLTVSVTRPEEAPLHGLIGTDVVLTGAVDGAALVDGRGAVLGLTTAAGGGTGVRAVPIDLVRQVADDIIETGGPAHPWLGVEGRDLQDASAAVWGVAGGAQLAEVTEGGPAAAAGLHDGDVVTEVGTLTITSMGELITVVRRHDPGDRLRIGYLRDGEHHWSAARLAPPT